MPTLTQILEITSNVCDVPVNQILSHRRSTSSSIARGLYYLIAREHKYHPSVIAKTVSRSRCSCIIVINHYRGYLQIRDRNITNLYNKITEEINNL